MGPGHPQLKEELLPKNTKNCLQIPGVFPSLTYFNKINKTKKTAIWRKKY